MRQRTRNTLKKWMKAEPGRDTARTGEPGGGVAQAGGTAGRGRIGRFQKERTKLNDLVMKYAGRNIKRFYSVDWQAYEPGALPKATKELLGLVASLVLRCDDCVTYHLINCFEQGVTDGELEEALGIGLVVGGSITIPHLRRAFRTWEEMKANRTVELNRKEAKKTKKSDQGPN